MDPLKFLNEQIENLEKLLGVPPARTRPKSIEFTDLDPSIHSTSSLRGDKLLISRTLEVEKIIKKEALSLFIPEGTDLVPQIHDLSWIYSEIDESIWKPLRDDPPRIFSNYNTLISKLNGRTLLRILREVVLPIRCSALRDQLTFSLYFALLRRALSRELKLSKAEREIVKLLSVNPYANPEEMRAELGLSDATISRAIRKLRESEFLFGPENVDIWKLGLTVAVADFPNERNYKEAFWEFPYTYTQMTPLSRYSRAHAYLVVPPDSLRDLRKLQKQDVRIGVVKRTLQRFNYGKVTGNIASIASAYLRSHPSASSVSIRVSPPPVKLTREDIRVLNIVMKEGKVTETSLKRSGIRSAKLRLNKLRNSGILKRYYMVGYPPGFDILLIRVECGVEEMNRLAETLGSLATIITHYIEGDKNYCLTIALAEKEVKSELLVGVKVIYGDEVEIAEEVLTPCPLWLFPEELWDERRQTFRWEEPLNRLVEKLENG